MPDSTHIYGAGAIGIKETDAETAQRETLTQIEEGRRKAVSLQTLRGDLLIEERS